MNPEFSEFARLLRSVVGRITAAVQQYRLRSKQRRRLLERYTSSATRSLGNEVDL
jgi:hypothetical protein